MFEEGIGMASQCNAHSQLLDIMTYNNNLMEAIMLNYDSLAYTAAVRLSAV